MPRVDASSFAADAAMILAVAAAAVMMMFVAAVVELALTVPRNAVGAKIFVLAMHLVAAARFGIR